MSTLAVNRFSLRARVTAACVRRSVHFWSVSMVANSVCGCRARAAVGCRRTPIHCGQPPGWAFYAWRYERRDALAGGHG